MASLQNSRISAHIGQILGVTALALSGAVVTVYVMSRIRRQRRTQHLLDTMPQGVSTAADIALATTAAADEVETSVVEDVAVLDDTPEQTDSEVRKHTPELLASLTVDELYQLAQRHDIVGRSSMRKAQLVEALLAAGVDNSAQ